MAKEIRYIGKSIAEARKAIEADLQRGTYPDGTAVKPEVKDALTKISKALAIPALDDHYIVCWSDECFIISPRPDPW